MIQLGYYGKTIHRGDFVKFNLPTSFVTVIDDWLQSLMVLGEETHGTAWPDIYHQSPAYRFLLSESIAGETAWFGFLSASRDKVGRRFPFCLAGTLPGHIVAPWGESAIDTCQLQLEQLFREVPTEAFDFDGLQERLSELAQQFSDAFDGAISRRVFEGTTESTERLLIRSSGSNPLSSNIGTMAMLDSVLKRACFSYSIWIPITDAELQAQTCITAGLPAEADGLALFDTRWTAGDRIEFSGISAISTELPDTITSEISAMNDADHTSIEPVSDVFTDDDWSLLTSDESPSEDQPAISEETGYDAPPETPSTEPPKAPTVEPLELDEDTGTTAPWD